MKQKKEIQYKKRDKEQTLSKWAIKLVNKPKNLHIRKIANLLH